MTQNTPPSTARIVLAYGKDLFALAQAQQLPFLAAAISYYAFVSVVPLFIVGFAIASTVASEALANRIVVAVGDVLTPEASSVLESALLEDSGRSGLTAIGLVVLLWSGLRVFRGIDIAFSRIYGAEVPKPLARQLRDALVVLGAISLAVGGTASVAALLPMTATPLSGILGTIGVFLFLPVVMLPLYYVFPSQPVTVVEALPGAVFAGGGWTILGTAFGVYSSYAGSFQLYGVLGGVLLLLVWFYFAGLVLLVGAALNVVIAERSGDRQLQQGALRENDQRATMTGADGPTDGRPDDGQSADDEGVAGVDDGTDGGDDRTDGDCRTDGGTTGGGPNDNERSDGDAPDGSEAPSTAETGGSPDGPGDGSSDGLDGDPTEEPDRDPTRRADLATLDDLDDLRQEIQSFEEEIEGRTVHRDDLESDLKQYVRKRVRRGHAHGWGPYLVLLYGTVMTLGAFYFLSGLWAILAMFVIWLSTLGLYTLMVLVGLIATGLGLPGRIIDRLRNLR